MTRLLARAAALPAALTFLAAVARPCAAQGDDSAGPLLVNADSVRVTLGGYLQADGRLARGPVPGLGGVLLRRARLTFDLAGRGGWALRLQPDFGQGRAQIQDGYVAWTRGGIAARAGRFRPAFGVERSLSSSTLLFPERGIVNPFMPSRLFGAQAAWAGRHLTLSAGGFNAAGVRDALVDTDGDPVGVSQAGADGVVRAVFRPWTPRPPRSPDEPGGLPRLELQAATMLGRYRGQEAEFRGVERFLTPAQRPALALDGGSTEDGADAVFADGVRRRTSAGAQLAAGPLHLLAEGAWFAQAVRRGPAEPASDRARLDHAAWQVRAGWLVGGTRTTDLDVRPRRRRGAVEVGGRAGAAYFDRAAARFAEPGAAARSLASAGVAAMWIPRRGTRLGGSVDVARLRGDARTTGTETALALRVQQGF